MSEHPRLRAALNHFGRVPPQLDWQMARHVHHEFHELIVVMSGTLEVTIRGQHLRGQRGDILTYPRGVWHAERSVGPDPLETLFVAWQWRESSAATDWPLHTTDRDGRVQGLVRWMQELSPPTRLRERHMLGVLLDALLFEVAQLSQSREQRIVAQAKAFVQNHMTETMKLDDLADAVGLSKYHFSRAFKEATGVTPMAFVRQVRVDATRSLLLSTT